MQRYARSILASLDECVVDRIPQTQALELEVVMPALGPAPKLRAISVRQVGSFSGHLWEQTILPARARGRILNLCNTAPIMMRGQIVCIHDINTVLFPESYSLAFRTLYRCLLPFLGRTAAAVATVSQFSAEQLAAKGVVSRDKLVVIPNGHEHVSAWRDQAAEPHLPAALNTIVLLGSPAPHKNAQLVLDLADALAAHDLRVAVVGQIDDRVFKTNSRFELASNVAWLGALPDGDLAALLSRSLCLAFPSFVEGFGLPPLEAMALGCPVVASDRASMPEVCGDAALYAAPDRPTDWLAAFLRLRNEPGLREAMVAAGLRRAARFSWRQSAKLFIDAMVSADKVRTGPSRLVRPGGGKDGMN